MARKYEEPKAKPTNDAYTGMLVVSFIALLVGCGLLYLDYSQYDPKQPAKLQREVREQRPAPESEPKKQRPDTEDTGKDTGTDEKDAKDKDKDTEKKDTPKQG
jgi:hypothetical protein